MLIAKNINTFSCKRESQGKPWLLAQAAELRAFTEQPGDGQRHLWCFILDVVQEGPHGWGLCPEPWWVPVQMAEGLQASCRPSPTSAWTAHRPTGEHRLGINSTSSD